MRAWSLVVYCTASDKVLKLADEHLHVLSARGDEQGRERAGGSARNVSCIATAVSHSGGAILSFGIWWSSLLFLHLYFAQVQQVAMSEANKPVQSGWGPAREWGNGKGQGVPSADGKPPTLPENHCRKKRPPRNNEKLFKDYYDEQLSYLDREDREGIFKCLGEPLPVTFRLVGPLQSGSDSADADRCDKQLRDIISASLGADALQRLSWYPHQAAWQMTIGKKDIKKVAGLQGFLLQEVAAGRLVRMEAVSMIPALVLGARPGDLVLDMCAAPGSKTGMCLESVMHTRKTIDNSQVGEGSMGAVIANDPDLQRSKMMVSRTKALCSPSLVVTALPGQSFPQLMSAEAKPVMFDRVLCDVPCSGDGTLRKAPFNLKTWHISHALQYHLLQTLLLQRSIELTAIGGIIVYSTCSLNPIENEAVIAHVVSQAAGAIEICPCPSALAALKQRPGMLHWRVPDSNFPGKWYDRFDDVVTARTAKAHAREAFRSPCHSLFADTGCACVCVAWHSPRVCTLTLSCAGC